MLIYIHIHDFTQLHIDIIARQKGWKPEVMNLSTVRYAGKNPLGDHLQFRRCSFSTSHTGQVFQPRINGCLDLRLENLCLTSRKLCFCGTMPDAR